MADKDFVVKNGLVVNTNALVVDGSTNKVGVNTASPDAAFSVVGTANVSGNVALTGSTLTVSANTTLNGNLVVNSNTYFNERIFVGNNNLFVPLYRPVVQAVDNFNGFVQMSSQNLSNASGNSSLAYITINNSGSGYDNTDYIVVSSTLSGSVNAIAAIVTDSSGHIESVAIENVGRYLSSPSTSYTISYAIKKQNGTPSSGIDASLTPFVLNIPAGENSGTDSCSDLVVMADNTDQGFTQFLDIGINNSNFDGSLEYLTVNASADSFALGANLYQANSIGSITGYGLLKARTINGSDPTKRDLIISMQRGYDYIEPTDATYKDLSDGVTNSAVASFSHRNYAFTIGKGNDGYLYVANGALTLGTSEGGRRAYVKQLSGVSFASATNVITVANTVAANIIATQDMVIVGAGIPDNTAIQTVLSNTSFRLTKSTTAISSGAYNIYDRYYDTSGNPIVFHVNGMYAESEVGRFVGNGNFVIGPNTTSRDSKFTVAGTANITGNSAFGNNISVAGNSTVTGTVNASAVLIGANVVLNTTTVQIGNTIANLVANSILVKVSNTTSTANLTPLDLKIGGTVVSNTVVQVGTAAVLTSDNIKIGATTNAVTVNTTAILIGNSLISSVVNSTIFTGTSYNSGNLNNQPASYYTNATNINAGTIGAAYLPTGNVTTIGGLKINDSVTNNSTTDAAALNSVKNAYDRAIDANTRAASAQTAAIAAYSNAVANAIALASAAYTNAVSNAVALASTAYSNAVTYADSKAATAYSNAVSTAASDASSKAATAFSNAVANAASYTDSKSSAAYSNAIAYSGNAALAYANAVSTAASDASSKAATAFSNAVANAASDATSKAATAFSNAVANAKSYTDTAVLNYALKSGTTFTGAVAVNNNLIVNNGNLSVNGIVSTTANVNIDSGTLFVDAVSNRVGVNTSTLTDGAALRVVGGANVTGDLWIGGNFNVTGTFTTVGTTQASGDFVPSTNNSFSLGNTTFRWANVYVNNAIMNVASAVNFTGTTVNATSTISVGTAVALSNSLIKIGDSTYYSSMTNTTIETTGSSIANTFRVGTYGNTSTGGIIANSTAFAVGNSSVNTIINSTVFTGSANNSTYLNGQAASYYLNTTNILDSVVSTSVSSVAAANSVKNAYDRAIDANTRASSAQTAAIAAYTNATSYTDGRIIDSVTNNFINYAASANSVKNAYDRAIDANTRAASAQTAAASAYTNAIAYSGNAAQAFTNAVSYVDGLKLDSVTNTSLIYIATANSVKNAYDRAIDANTRAASAQTAAASAYSNAIAYSGNAALAFSNAVTNAASYTDTKAATAFSNAVANAMANVAANYAALAGATFTGAVNVSNNLVITGNLTVTGTTFSANVINLDVTDKNITVAKGVATAALADGAGITVDTANATWNYNNATTSWQSNVAITPATNNNLGFGTAGLVWSNGFITNVYATTVKVGATTITTANAILGGSVTVNGSIGTAGQVLTSAGSGAGANAYWTTPTTGTVTSVATANGIGGGTITGTGSLYVVANNGLVSNTTGLFVLANNGIVANSTGTWAKQANGISVDASGINVLANSGLVSNSTGVFVLANTGIVSNTTGVYVNATYIATISANNAAYLGGVIASGYQTTAGLSANVATLTANNSGYLGGVIAASYQLNSTLAANVATMTANNSGYLGGTIASGYQTTAGLSANVATLTANNTTYFGGLYTWAAPAALGSGTANTGAFTTLNATTSANVGANVQMTTTTIKVGNTTLSTTNAIFGGTITTNGSIGLAGQVLTSAAGGNAYWATATGGAYYKGNQGNIGATADKGNLYKINSNTQTVDVTIDDGENAMTAGPISIVTGKTLTISTGGRMVIV